MFPVGDFILLHKSFIQVLGGSVVRTKELLFFIPEGAKSNHCLSSGPTTARPLPIPQLRDQHWGESCPITPAAGDAGLSALPMGFPEGNVTAP